MLAFHLLFEHLLPGARERARRALRLAFVAAVYLFAASYGMHEATDYLNARFCDGAAGADVAVLCDVVAYQDDELSHLLFFGGFAGIDVALLVAEAAAPRAQVALSPRDYSLIGINAAFVAASIVANLGFEEIGLDLLVVALVAALALALWRRQGPRPLTVYFAGSYAVGLALSIGAKLV